MSRLRIGKDIEIFLQSQTTTERHVVVDITLLFLNNSMAQFEQNKDAWKKECIGNLLDGLL